MFFIIALLFTKVVAFGNGPECEHSGLKMGKGNCIKVKDCTTNEWLFGHLDNPTCDEPGADYKSPDTKVCCFSKPLASGASGASGALIGTG